MTKDPESLANQEWLGYVQPAGLVVSIAALLAAQAHINRNIATDPQRLLACLPRDKQVPIGLLVSDSQIRLVYAPRGETSGFATCCVAEMVQVARRPIFAALYMLLGEERLFSLGEKQRLTAILADSRKYQNVGRCSHAHGSRLSCLNNEMVADSSPVSDSLSAEDPISYDRQYQAASCACLLGFLEISIICV